MAEDEGEDEVLRVCNRTSDMLVAAEPSAVVDECPRCGMPVWFTVDQLVPPGCEGGRLVCTRCLVWDRRLREACDPGVLRMVRRQHALIDGLRN